MRNRMSFCNWLGADPVRAVKRLSMVFLFSVLLWTPIMLAQGDAPAHRRIDRLPDRVGQLEDEVSDVREDLGAIRSLAESTLKQVQSSDTKLWGLVVLGLFAFAGFAVQSLKHHNGKR